MKIFKYALLILTAAVLIISCRNKTVVLLTQKWDCVQVENLVQPDAKFSSPQDSASAVQLQSLVSSMSWSFKNNMRYECMVNSTITAAGKYELLEDDKILVLTTKSKKNTNRYIINKLDENELVISGRAENTNLVLHFRAR